MEDATFGDLHRRFMRFCSAYLREYRKRHPGRGLMRGIADAEDARIMEELVRETGAEWLRKKD